MNKLESTTTTYEHDVLNWRRTMDEKLRAEDGWLTLIGLFWLHEGENTIGSAPGSDVPLPPAKVPDHLGVLTLDHDQVRFTVTDEEPVEIDAERLREAVLRADTDPTGPSYVKIQSVTFYVIERSGQYGIRARDRENPARTTFPGRQWFPINPAYCVTATFHAYPEPRTVQVVNAIGMLVPMQSPGCVEFNLDGHPARLEAFEGDDGVHPLWFVLKDSTSGPLTYPAGRFLNAPLSEDGVVTLDFNRAYHPPCAFTAFATCPLPPRANVLPFAIEAGEMLPDRTSLDKMP